VHAEQPGGGRGTAARQREGRRDHLPALGAGRVAAITEPPQPQRVAQMLGADGVGARRARQQVAVLDRVPQVARVAGPLREREQLDDAAAEAIRPAACARRARRHREEAPGEQRDLLAPLAQRQQLGDAVAEAAAQVRQQRYKEVGDFSVEGLAAALARDFGERALDVVVHSLANGPEVKRPLLETTRGGYLAAVEELHAREVGTRPAFLASPLAAGITGATIYVDKGYHAMGMAVAGVEGL
jgi:hypothetical protein